MWDLVGSAICAAAPSSDVLIFGRALLGLGAAGLLQGALAIIGAMVSVEKVPVFQAVVISSLVVSVCVGPVIGGVLTEYASWRTSLLPAPPDCRPVGADFQSRVVFLDVSPLHATHP
jgi:MFS family permease